MGTAVTGRLPHDPRLSGDAGQVTAFTVVITAALLLLAGLVIDAGLALAAKTRALDLAQSAARTGAQQLDLTAYRVDGIVRLDPDRAEQAARNYLAAAHIAGTATATSRGISVTVHTLQRTQILRIVGIGAIEVRAEATARPRHGVTEPEEGTGPP